MTQASATPKTDRARVIASIHALADYLAEHPEHPTPFEIMLTRYAVDGDEPARVREVMDWAAAAGGRLFEGQNGVMGTVMLMDASHAGVEILYRQHAVFDDATVKRYVK